MAKQDVRRRKANNLNQDVVAAAIHRAEQVEAEFYGHQPVLEEMQGSLQQIVQQLQQQGQQLQQQGQQLQQLQDQLLECFSKSQNAAVADNTDLIKSLLRPSPEGFPETLQDLKQLDARRVSRLLRAHGLPVDGTPQTKRRRLALHLGLRASLF
eukprot:CAMPEP_0177643436 /NCGR_PEP_ID=MMETSP0447-20121125/8154_1 /TAXON_ID=0 /ORGANISM="Stygamoeba regulata, Strain BSH-02190019" /LENGTH=153 /DNA_ID=CAMNT_0019145731 /DNA_START=177 /DNA_END=638 /DNA_ORIENTATION=+